MIGRIGALLIALGFLAGAVATGWSLYLLWFGFHPILPLGIGGVIAIIVGGALYSED